MGVISVVKDLENQTIAQAIYEVLCALSVRARTKRTKLSVGEQSAVDFLLWYMKSLQKEG